MKLIGFAYRIITIIHNHNTEYNNDINIYIISSVFNPQIVQNAFAELNKSNHSILLRKQDIEAKITQEFIRDFLMLYDTGPKYMPRLLERYGIAAEFKNFIWFKQMLQDKCLQFSQQNSTLAKQYRQTFLSNWNIGDRLVKF